MRAPERKTSFLQQQVENLQKNYAVMVGLILLFVVAVVWMIVSIAQTEDNSDLTRRAQANTDALNPNLDRETLELVAAKHNYDTEELRDFPIFVLIEDKNGEFQVVDIHDVAERLEAINAGQTIDEREPQESGGSSGTNSPSLLSLPASANEQESEPQPTPTATPVLPQ